MKIIQNKDKYVTIFLEDNDILEIRTIKSKENFIVKCQNTTLHIDELSSKELNNIKQEKDSIKKMKDYLEKK